MKTLVIGGSGFLGSYIVDALLDAGHELAVMSRDPKTAARALPASARVIRGDLSTLSGARLEKLLAPFQALVYAAGSDERTRPDGDARDFFFRENVDTCRRVLQAACAVDCDHVVVLNSIFTHVNRQRPDFELARHHPYIASRIAQSDMVLEVARGHFNATVLEVPWVFGDSRGRASQWAPIVHYARYARPIISPRGGAIAISAENVGRAVAGALALPAASASRSLPIGDCLLSWDSMLVKLARLSGRASPKILRMPDSLFAGGNALGALALRTARIPTGLDFARMHEFLLEQIDADLEGPQKALAYRAADIDAALQATVHSVPALLPPAITRRALRGRPSGDAIAA